MDSPSSGNQYLVDTHSISAINVSHGGNCNANTGIQTSFSQICEAPKALEHGTSVLDKMEADACQNDWISTIDKNGMAEISKDLPVNERDKILMTEPVNSILGLEEALSLIDECINSNMSDSSDDLESPSDNFCNKIVGIDITEEQTVTKTHNEFGQGVGSGDTVETNTAFPVVETDYVNVSETLHEYGQGADSRDTVETKNIQPSSNPQLLNKRKFDSMESNTVPSKLIKFPEDSNDANPHDVNDKLNIDIEETLRVNKMTLSKNYIYMDCFEVDDYYETDDIHRIYIFSNKKPFKKVRKLEMREVTCESLALASSSKSDVLFILECCSRECSEDCGHAKRIFLVPYFEDQPHEWTRVVSGYPLDLSAESTRERLLVTVRDEDTATNYFKWYVYAYNMWTQRDQPERIELPEEINNVSKVKELSNGYLAVVYERSDLEYSNESQGLEKNKYYFISHVTWNGDIVCRYPLPSHCSHLGIINNNMVVFDIENGDYSDIIVFDYETNACQYIMQDPQWNIYSLCYVEQKQLLMVGHDFGFNLVTLEGKCLKNISALPGPNQLKECGISRLQQSSFDQLSPRFGVRLLHDAVLRKVKNISSMAWVNNRIVVAVQGEGVLFFSDKVPFRQYKSETIRPSYYFCRTSFIAASNCGQALFVCCNRNIEKIEFPNKRKSTWNDCLKQKWEVLSLSCNADNLVALVKRCGAHDYSDNFLKDSDFGFVVYNPVAENWCTPNKIELPKSLNEPLESIESSNGHFIIACEIHRTTLKESSSKLDDDTRSYDENCWAYEVSREGNVTRKFMCFDDSFDWHVRSCWLYGYIKYGLLLEEDNRIFLLDHKNNRLIISNSGNDCEVMSTHEIGKPTNMCYMRQKQQLIVARKTESDVAVSIYNLLWN